MLLDTRFISAMEARCTVRAQLNAEKPSGNSETNGATHWMKKKVDMPKVTATDCRLSRNGSARK